MDFTQPPPGLLEPTGANPLPHRSVDFPRPLALRVDQFLVAFGPRNFGRLTRALWRILLRERLTDPHTVGPIAQALSDELQLMDAEKKAGHSP